MANDRKNRLAELLHCFELDGKSYVCAPRKCLEFSDDNFDSAMQQMLCELVPRGVRLKKKTGRQKSGRNTVPLRLSQTSIQALRRLARDENMSVSATVETLILQYFAELNPAKSSAAS